MCTATRREGSWRFAGIHDRYAEIARPDSGLRANPDGTQAPPQKLDSCLRISEEKLNALPTDVYRYWSVLEQELRETPWTTQGYINGNTGMFERIASTEVAFNRMVLYPSNALALVQRKKRGQIYFFCEK